MADGETIGGDFIQGARSVNSRRPDAELEEESDYGITERIRDFMPWLSPSGYSRDLMSRKFLTD